MTLRGVVAPRGPTAPLAATALLLALAYPPFDLLVPSFVALVPFAVWTAGLADGRAGRREALRGGFLAGLLFYALLLHWIAVSLAFHTALAVPAFAATVLVLAGLLAACALGIHQTTTRLGWPVWLALPVFWTAMEWARAHLGDLSFPWMQLGDSLTGWPRLIGAADVVGSRGLSFWLALVNGLLAEALLRWRPAALERWTPSRPPGLGRPGARGDRARGEGQGPAGGASGPAWRPVAAALLAVAVPVAYSLHRWATLDPEPAARVAVLQPDVPEGLRLGAAAAADSARAAIAGLAGRAWSGDAGGLDLVVLPETALPVAVSVGGEPGGGAAAAAPRMTALAARLDAPVLFGAPSVRGGGDEGRGERFNSAFLRAPDGRRVGRYDKRRLVPGFETVPFLGAAGLRDELGTLLGPRFGGLTAGPRRPGLLKAGAASFGVLICYESVFAGLSRRYRRRGADFLVNITNDAWFGRSEPSWVRTSGLWQHPAHLVMRAVETRTGVVRSANTGFSAIVDPSGRVRHRTELFEPAAFAGTVFTTEGTTPYVRWGDVLGRLAALAAAGGLAAVAVLGRRERGA